MYLVHTGNTKNGTRTRIPPALPSSIKTLHKVAILHSVPFFVLKASHHCGTAPATGRRASRKACM